MRESLGIFSSLQRGHAVRAWGGNVIILTKFLRPSMHLGPWSSARSHSLGQPTTLSTSTSLRSRSLDNISSLMSRGSGQVSTLRCSIVEVKSEWKNSSRSQYSQIKQTESISSNRDFKVWELTISCISEEIFLRKVSFLVRHNALADPSQSTMDAEVLENHIGNLRSLLLSSPKECSVSNESPILSTIIEGLEGCKSPPLNDLTRVRDLPGVYPCSHRQRKISLPLKCCDQLLA